MNIDRGENEFNIHSSVLDIRRIHGAAADIPYATFQVIVIIVVVIIN